MVSASILAVHELHFSARAPMCHHYRLLADKRELRKATLVPPPNEQKKLPCGDFYPLSRVPVVRLNKQGEREVVEMEWGLLPFWWKPSARRTSRKAFQRKCFNARCETIQEKPAFREAFKHRRCLIPATEFFERGHYFHFANGEPILFAGLWEHWQGGSETVESCTIVTTTSNEAIQSVGHHRMPVILDDRGVEVWLTGDDLSPAEMELLCRPFDSAALSCYRPE